MPSTVVASVKYEPRSRTLRVIYISGLVYDYQDVPEEVYLEMKSSSSKGSFLNQRIKGKYQFEKVNKEDQPY